MKTARARWRTGRTPWLLGGLTVAAVATALVLARSDRGSGEEAARDPARSVGEQWAALVDRGLREARRQPGLELTPFSALRERPMPAAARRAIRATLPESGALRLRFDRARYGEAGKVGIWLLAGRGVTCLSREGSGATLCDSAVQVAQRGIVLQTYWTSATGQPTRYLATGVVPDGVGSLPAKAGTDPRRIPVTANAFAAAAGAPIEIQLPKSGKQLRREV